MVGSPLKAKYTKLVEVLQTNTLMPTIQQFWNFGRQTWTFNWLIQQSCAFYVCSYICKSEPEELRNALSKLISNVLNVNPDIAIQTRMLYIGHCVLKSRRLSAQEAAYRLSDLNMYQSSRTTLSVNVKPPTKIYRLLKPKRDRMNLPPDSKDIFQSSQLDYYRKRLDRLSSMCFYEFAAWYTTCPAPSPKGTRARLEQIKILDPYNI